MVRGVRAPSPIDAFFRSEAQSLADVLAAVNEIRRCSRGEVVCVDLFRLDQLDRPALKGLYCPQLFGCAVDFTCDCRRTFPEGEACPRCEVVSTPSSWRAERWAHIELPCAVLHPAVVGSFVEILGVAPDDIRALFFHEAILNEGRIQRIELDELYARDFEDAGPEALRQMLRDRGRPEAEPDAPCWITIVPVSPPGDRQLVHLPLAERDRFVPVISERVPPVSTAAYQTLVSRAYRMKRLLELSAPQIITNEEHRAMQSAFDALLREIAADRGGHPTPPSPSAFGDPDDNCLDPIVLRGRPTISDATERRVHHDAPLSVTRPRACAFLRSERLVLQLGYALLEIELAAARVSFLGPATEETLLGAVGSRLIFGAKYGRQLWEGRVSGLYVFDASARAWLPELPADMPVVFVEKDQPEDAWLQDWRNGRSAPVVDPRGDRPNEVARTPDHRYIVIGSPPDGEAVHSTETGRCHLCVSDMRLEDQQAPILGRNGLGRVVGRRGDLDNEAFAIARRDGRWLILDLQRGVSDDGIVQFRIPISASAAAFDETASLLAAVNERVVLVIDVVRRHIVHAFDLRPLGLALGVARWPGVGVQVKDFLLASFGTLDELSRATDQAILGAHPAEGSSGKPRITKRHVAAIRAMKAPALPAALPEYLEPLR